MGAWVNRKKDQEKNKDEEAFNIKKEERTRKASLGVALDPRWLTERIASADDSARCSDSKQRKRRFESDAGRAELREYRFRERKKIGRETLFSVDKWP